MAREGPREKKSPADTRGALDGENTGGWGLRGFPVRRNNAISRPQFLPRGFPTPWTVAETSRVHFGFIGKFLPSAARGWVRGEIRNE